MKAAAHGLEKEREERSPLQYASCHLGWKPTCAHTHKDTQNINSLAERPTPSQPNTNHPF